ncbi:hypothetical protein UY3_13542 [Chelonia mydas]|uniref:Uncharacterized protein n=1 Tax=Chelonia mydas TaxID=8469 RepID=M7AX63_CHEMY|nr:hypothetical protein UY3_13542 [Chelonia mydas]
MEKRHHLLVLTWRRSGSSAAGQAAGRVFSSTSASGPSLALVFGTEGPPTTMAMPPKTGGSEGPDAEDVVSTASAMQGAVEKLLYNVATVYLYVVFISILCRCDKSVPDRSAVNSCTPPRREAEAESTGERRQLTPCCEDVSFPAFVASLVDVPFHGSGSYTRQKPFFQWVLQPVANGFGEIPTPRKFKTLKE